MAKPLTRCPECSSKITNRFECRNCGLLFNRYFEAQARKRKEEKAKAAQKAKTGRIVNLVLSTVAIVIFCVGGIYYFNSKKQPQVVTAPDTPTQEKGATNEIVETAQESAQPRTKAPVTKSGNAISIAINATAIIQSPWGQGTGFFIKDNKFITNRHAAEYNEERLEKDIQQFNENQKLITEDQIKIDDLKEQSQTITDTQKKSEFEAAIKKRQERLERKIARHQEDDKRITIMREKIKTPDIVILLSDGRKVRMAYMETSSNHNLALLTILSTGIPEVKIADKPLKAGDPVYSLGKNKTSINGSFSGHDGDGYITTDAPVNLIYSGGPLIDEEGMVHAISILPAPDAKGIGRAVPIATVQQEFSL